MPVSPLPPDRLYVACDPADLPFATTAELPDSDAPVGQDRAVAALTFAMGMAAEGYNLFALGIQGTGKESLVRRHLAELAAAMPGPDDWCYVHDFAQPHRPRALSLPHGRGRPFAQAMAALIEDMTVALPRALDSEAVAHRRQALEQELKARQEAAFGDVQKAATEHHLTLVRLSSGLALAPLGEDGEVLAGDAFQKLPEARREALKRDMARLQEQLDHLLRQMPRWERDTRRKVRALERQVAAEALDHLMEDLKAEMADLPQVLEHLDAVTADIVDNLREVLRGEAEGEALPAALASQPGGPLAALRRYRVNCLVHHADGDTAPVVVEDHPTQPNLVGRLEHLQHFGALIADFNLIKPGALHRANGGFLVLEAHKVLAHPFAWQDLKRALKAREIRIEPPGQASGLLPTLSLDPQAIPLRVKVVLLGEPMIFYLLSEHDPDFRELFKVAADFDYRMARSPANTRALAGLLGTIARREGLKPLSRDAVARVIEHGARLVEDQGKLTTHMASLADLMREADHLAGLENAATVGQAHIEAALKAQIARLDRVREHIQEEIEEGTVLIATSGAEVGQVNGLTVMQLGTTLFGRPARISCRVRMGRGELIDIEREVDLGGPLHSKGVMILSAFLAARFAEDTPLSLSASLVFEQSHGPIEGDSASTAELCALLSALAEVPLAQGLAITGAVDQTGRVQAIGGVNEKIEGFFDICAARGLSGDQGVIIPASNARHLMLRADVVEACRDGRFAIHPVETVDQAIETLTGLPAGERQDDGGYPAGSVNRKVAARLAALHRRQRQLYGEAPDPARGRRLGPREEDKAADPG
ncbi:Lon protease family protein [Roseospirillum parvum]|uniref:endopeptidase La n=1 Tax=Roseospirillum parvum TaxID=83401 RepID=A0A1G8BCD2_9PROT|nr:ATP-binding protein [Roseospirillum parvum]SDH30859.1 Predicted ATP-dependent protease [Roseospirillum parvum]